MSNRNGHFLLEMPVFSFITFFFCFLSTYVWITTSPHPASLGVRAHLWSLPKLERIQVVVVSSIGLWWRTCWKPRAEVKQREASKLVFVWNKSSKFWATRKISSFLNYGKNLPFGTSHFSLQFMYFAYHLTPFCMLGYLNIKAPLRLGTHYSFTCLE